ncbi:NAD(P)/FAD-dependent oxidoreductase [Rhizosaccharibacter radicis]|uniref:NADH:ubiquinone reductase (non-electrogenic) n=1 Tax=Rhizosaccharibacter radicis TaxID=2782605 RepID=A0ABT1VUE6_9PROT|nr:NAD(P)/FAD-dependent oxidoreductase [Acetobacteraceae bacterium KSS12]
MTDVPPQRQLPNGSVNAVEGGAKPHRIVIVGCGFGGLAAAKRLARTEAQVTVIDRTNHNLFQPLLYQVAVAALSADSISTPVRSAFRGHPNVSTVMGTVTGVDRAARLVMLEDGTRIGFDTLILASGSVYSWFGHPDWAERAPALKTAADAILLRDRILSAFEHAELQTDPDAARRLLCFAVVGAGPTGVELAGAIAELSRTTLARDFRRIRPGDARVVLCDAGPRVLAAFPDHLSDYAARRLRELGVELHLGAAVDTIDDDGIVAGGTRIEAGNVFWAAGTEATPVAKWLGVEAGKNGLVAVEPDCSLPGDPSVFVLGDASRMTGENGKPLPALGAVAKQQGAYVGDLLARRLSGRAPPKPFRYRNLGELATLGGSSAVANFGFVRLTGLPAWIVWSAVHLLLLVSLRNRLVVYVNWMWAWLTYGRGARVILQEPQRAQQTAFHPAPAPR